MPTQSRQLAAIMFTDIVGYTALMGNDEQKAMQLLDQNRVLQKPLIEEYRGRYLKEMGDGILWLEKAYDSHDTELTWLKVDPMFKPLQNDPRYQDLLKRVGFEE